MVRGEVFRLRAPRSVRGREQRGARYGVVVQADELLTLSTVLIAPTSTRAQPADFRPLVDLDDAATRVLVDHTTVVDPERLGRSAGRLEAAEVQAVDQALALIFGLAA
jgi:mRNA interferase MazF